VYSVSGAEVAVAVIVWLSAEDGGGGFSGIYMNGPLREEFLSFGFPEIFKSRLCRSQPINDRAAQHSIKTQKVSRKKLGGNNDDDNAQDHSYLSALSNLFSIITIIFTKSTFSKSPHDLCVFPITTTSSFKPIGSSPKDSGPGKRQCFGELGTTGFNRWPVLRS